MNKSEVREQPAVSTVEPRSACGEHRRTACGEHRRTDIGLSTFRPSTFRHRNRRGMTLVEVILAAAILGMLAIVVVNALFYPRLLVVSSALRQQAVSAGTDALEQAFSTSYDSLYDRTDEALPNLSGKYNMNGRTVSGTLSVETLGGSEEYKHIIVTVNYPNGQNPVVLETYRSPLE